MEPADSSVPKVQEITFPEKIRRFLEKALEEELTAEVQLNRRTRTFFSAVLDHPPDLLEVTDDAGNVCHEESEYVPNAYLQNGLHLILAPLDPPVGNALIRTSDHVLLRFFQGLKSIEAEVQFVEVLLIRGEPAIKVTFPEKLLVESKRRHFRAEITPQMGVTFTVTVGRKKTVGQLVDLSASGLAFHSDEEESLTVDSQASFLIEFPKAEPIRLTGIIRRINRIQGRKAGSVVKLNCGVQLDLVSKRDAMRLEELVATAQRVRLQTITNRRTKAMVTREPPPEKPSLSRFQEEMNRFFAHKKKQGLDK